tara:strand:- start:3935 stop:4126 length:192 start_codon:yes stop_codon:yes gene_type:complete
MLKCYLLIKGNRKMTKKMYYINSDGHIIKPQGMFKNTPRATQKLLKWKRIWIDESKIKNENKK